MHLPVLFQDQYLLAVDKPAGILSVPPSGGGERNVADYLRRKAQRKGTQLWPVHRLDRETSGVLLFARTARARQTLEQAFREHTVQKIYLALVCGRPQRSQGVLKTFIVDQGKIAVSSRQPIRSGRIAVTAYRLLEHLQGASLMEARPTTGRHNQIRLHMVDLGCPILGDRKYAVASMFPVKSRRTLLHASNLRVTHPVSGKMLSFQSDLPDDFHAVLQQLRDA